MRELSIREVESVSGGGLTGIPAGFQALGVIGALTTAYTIGYATGGAINSAFEWYTGQTVGTYLYNSIN